MSQDSDERKARAEAKFKKSSAQAVAGAEAKAEHDAAVATRDANTERLKGLRLARDESEREAVALNKSRRKIRKPAPG